MNAPLSAEDLEARLRKVGEERYHDKHPFHQLMNAGKLSKGQLQAWALNRFYYQAMIPIKDAAILSRMEHAELRRAWRQRIIFGDRLPSSTVIRRLNPERGNMMRRF